MNYFFTNAPKMIEFESHYLAKKWI